MKTTVPMVQALNLEGMSISPEFSARWVAPLEDTLESFALDLIDLDGIHHSLVFDVWGYLSCKINPRHTTAILSNGLYLWDSSSVETTAPSPDHHAVAVWKKLHPSVQLGKLHVATLSIESLWVEMVIAGAEFDFVNVNLENNGR